VEKYVESLGKFVKVKISAKNVRYVFVFLSIDFLGCGRTTIAKMFVAVLLLRQLRQALMGYR